MASLRGLAVRALSVIGVFATFALVGLAAALLVGIGPSFVGDESFVVADSRMQPRLSAGDLAIVEPVRVEQLAQWDVITYRSPTEPETVVTRRVVYLDAEPSGIVAEVRGDAEPAAEQIRFLPNAAIGRVVYSVARIGSLVTFANQPAGRLLLLGLPALLLGADVLRRRLGKNWRRSSRHQSLIEAGRRALRAGYPELAVKAANGVLAKDPHSRAAWLLLVEARHVSQANEEVERRHAPA